MSQNECEGIVADCTLATWRESLRWRRVFITTATVGALFWSCLCLATSASVRVCGVCAHECVCVRACVYVSLCGVCVRAVCVCVYGVHWASCRLLGQYALEQVWRSTLSDRPANKVVRKFKIILLWKYQHNSEHFESVTCSPCHVQLLDWSH